MNSWKTRWNRQSADFRNKLMKRAAGSNRYAEPLPTDGFKGGELEAAIVTDSFEGKGKIKSLKRELRQTKKDNRKLKRDINKYDYIDDQALLNNFVDRIINIKSPKTIKQQLDAEKDAYRSTNFLGIGDGSGNSIPSQLYRWWSRNYGFKHKNQNVNNPTAKSTDVIDLNKNVIRATPSSNQSTLLFNEFIETKNPSVYPASEYQNGNVTTFGDKNIPVENVSIYAGVEDGKFKADSLHNFKPNTVIYPARNIKKNTPLISKIVLSTDTPSLISKSDYYNIIRFARLLDKKTTGRPDEMIRRSFKTNEFKDANSVFKNTIDEVIRNNTDLDKSQIKTLKRAKRGNPVDINFMWLMRGGTGTYDPIWQQIQPFTKNLTIDDSWKQNKIYPLRPNSDIKVEFVDTDGNHHSISEYNSAVLDNKSVFANPNGGTFVGKLQNISQEQLNLLNDRLKENPSWLVRPDLGSFELYRTDNPTLEQYLKQYMERTSPEDPNVYTVGTTEDNKL